MEETDGRIRISPISFETLRIPTTLGKAEWEWMADALIKAAIKNKNWVPLKQKQLPLNKNEVRDPRQAIAEMIAAGFLVYTEDGYWLTKKALEHILKGNSIPIEV